MQTNLLWCSLLFLVLPAASDAQTNSYLDSTRPTISSDAAIQQKGVLQIESGYDAYFLPYDQTAATSVYYAATQWLRLDAGLSAWRSTDVGVAQRAQGVGDLSFGAKAVLFHDGRSRTVPGVAVEYEENVATASNTNLKSHYRTGTLILSNTWGNWKWKLNGMLIGYDCRHPDGCVVRGQGAFGLTYKLNGKTSLEAEVFGQPESVSAPPGAYLFTGLTHQHGKHIALNGGLRFGLNSTAPRIGATVGVTVALGGHPHRD